MELCTLWEDIVTHSFKKFPAYKETVHLLLCNQGLATGPFPPTVEYSLHLHKIHFNITSPICAFAPQFISPLHFSRLKLWIYFSYVHEKHVIIMTATTMTIMMIIIILLWFTYWLRQPGTTYSTNTKRWQLHKHKQQVLLLSRVAWLIRRVLDWMIGFIDTLFTQLGTTALSLFYALSSSALYTY
jgi:hypothetical protein